MADKERIAIHLPEWLPIRTERLELRMLTNEDIRVWSRSADDADVNRYLASAGRTFGVGNPDRVYRQIEESYRSMSALHLGVFLREGSGGIIGLCSFQRWDARGGKAELGFALSHEYWGRGYATEAASALAAFGFEHLELERIQARCFVKNLASLRVLAKIGMERQHRPEFGFGVKRREDELGIVVFSLTPEQLQLRA
ncbi:GNAT family protein [Saccharibacillus sp. CPCC 101409]|uniref:GNAT family N-acetyltransferase n=1 Tax=Saccharibacillus sp. CPCC 101409 TaxID=3058041 RepID=UPI002673236D|nr:GNAT family protein [Saccharibacillus sp. CPCC 101409]MDO3411050.1 GNAT family protein [Saccharibacillus sp. CPCC 101409]